MKRKALPKLKAKNAYELLAQIKRVILEEPKRYNQEFWIRTIDATPEFASIQPYPACGTIGCIAGWTAALCVSLDTIPVADGIRRGDRITAIASAALGLDTEQSDELFTGVAIEQVSSWDKVPNYGTRAYARLGAKHISNFMAKYKTQLLAKPVSRNV